MFERFTKRARTAVALAAERALPGREVTGADLLAGILAEAGGIGALTLGRLGVTSDDLASPSSPGSVAALSTLGIDFDEVRRRAEESFGPGALDRTAPARRRRRLPGAAPFSPEAVHALRTGLAEAQAMGHHFFGTEHLLLGVLAAGGPAATGLAARGVDLDRARDVVSQELRRRAS